MLCVSLTELNDEGYPYVILRYAPTMERAIALCQKWSKARAKFNHLIEIWNGDYNDNEPAYVICREPNPIDESDLA
jgi:hypothetical protein